MGHPRFKSKRGRQAAEFTRSARFHAIHTPGCRWGFLLLPKIGAVKLAWSRDLPSDPSSVTVVLRPDGHYEVSFVVDAETGPAPDPLRQACGVDLGLKDLGAMVYSDGTREKVPNPRHLNRASKRLRLAHKDFSRKVKGSKNREKARLVLARRYADLAHARQDFLRKLARRVAGENQAVALETLSVAGLARTRTGKSVLDASWGMLVRFICEYGDQWGRQVVQIGRWEPSTSPCCVCQHRGGRLPLWVRVWACPNCGARLDRDWNAAVNIMVAAGLADTLNACGDDVRLRLAGAVVGEAGTRRTGRDDYVAAA